MLKKFDAVRFQREVRKKLSAMYTSDRASFLRELEKKYGQLKREKVGPRSQ